MYHLFNIQKLNIFPTQRVHVFYVIVAMKEDGCPKQYLPHGL
jgi:hypothetical protein